MEIRASTAGIVNGGTNTIVGDAFSAVRAGKIDMKEKLIQIELIIRLRRLILEKLWQLGL